MRILILTMCLCAVFFAGCANQQTKIAEPVPVHIEGDEDKDCTTLKNELTNIERDIRDKKKEVYESNSGNFMLAAGGCFSVIPWFFMDMDSVGATETEITALQERYNALSTIANDKGCLMKVAPEILTGKAEPEKLPLSCKYCGPTKSDKWKVLDGQTICYDCYKKNLASK